MARQRFLVPSDVGSTPASPASCNNKIGSCSTPSLTHGLNNDLGIAPPSMTATFGFVSVASRGRYKAFAGMAYGLCSSLPSWPREFESPYLLLCTRSSVG